MNTQGASPSSSPSSSSSSTLCWEYDVFLSFRGKDTRNKFTAHLYTALVQKGIFTFRDDEKLKRGEPISKELLKAIEESRVAIVILSKRYASSTWCLGELAKIVECKKKMGLIVLPVFHYVRPSDVRDQKGPFKKDFDKHEADNTPQVKEWRDAFTEVASLSGRTLEERDDESSIIRLIVDDLLQRPWSKFSNFTKDLVGTDSPMEKLTTLYLGKRNSVCMIGICGMGGLGKSTLARAIYEMNRNHFEGSSFIATGKVLGEHDLAGLQKQLLAETLNESNINIYNVYDGAKMIKYRLHHKKVLIVLDNVHQLEQLKKLAGECCWFGSGSWIIITTRKKSLLDQHQVCEIYYPNTLNDQDALKLFCLKAFRTVQPKADYVQLSEDAVYCAKNLPLALVVLGSLLYGKTTGEWQSALNNLKKNPNTEIYDILKLSYDELNETLREIFLDIACFFKGKMKGRVVEILEQCGFEAEFGVGVLVDNSLITIENNKLCMHDLLQEMGWEIVRQESPKEPGMRSRLWLRKDLLHVLTKNTATYLIKAIVLDSFEEDEASMNLEACPEAFSQMSDLRLLIIDNVHIQNGLEYLSNDLRFLEWREYSAKCLPFSFQPKELVELKMWFSKIEYLWTGIKDLKKLKLIDLELSKKLIKTPNFTGVPGLERLYLRGCINLLKIHPSIGKLSRLTVLNLEFCQSLTNLPSNMDGLKSLKILLLLGCSKLAYLPENLGKIKCLEKLDFTGTAIRVVPSSISFLICHGREMQFYKSRLDIFVCFRLLKYLALSTDKLNFALPPSISQLLELEYINLGNCIGLHSLPEFPSNVRYINANGCSSLEPSPALLSVSNLLQPHISFFNCFKLVEYKESNDGLAFAMLKHYLQGHIYPKTGYKASNRRKDRSGAAFQIIIPGSEVPLWLTHQRIGYSIRIKLPPDWCNSRWVGFALCAFFRINCYGYSSERYSIKGCVITPGGKPQHTFEFFIGETSLKYSVGHLWLVYLSRDEWLATHGDDQCSQIEVVFDTNSPSMVVIKCAVRLIYEQDVEVFNKTIGTYDDNNVTETSASRRFTKGTERAMDKTKDEEKESKIKQFRWSKQMQCLLLEMLASDVTKGNKPSNTFLPGSFTQAAQAISEKFGVECQPNHVENCFRTIKSIWSTITQLRNRKNSFGWDDSLKMITCEKEVYDEEVMKHPDHEQYLNKKIEMYDEMSLIFGEETATWSSAKSFADIDSKKRIVDLESNDLDIDFKKASKRKQVSSFNAALSGASSHRKRSKRSRANVNRLFSEQLGIPVELAIEKKKKKTTTTTQRNSQKRST